MTIFFFKLIIIRLGGVKQNTFAYAFNKKVLQVI